MAFVHGKNTIFKLDDSGGTLRDLSAYLNNVDFPRDQNVPETTTFGVAGGSRTYLTGLNSATITVAGQYDSTATSGPDVVLSGLINAATTATFEYGPEGGSSGKVKYTGEALLTSYQTSSSVDGVCTFSGALQITGQVTRTTFP
ncbi:MAG: phage tail tube protein [Pseudonocardiaceae bacterium]